MSRSRSSARTELADYGVSSSPSGGSDSPGVAAEHAVPRQRSPLRSRSASAVVAQADRLAGVAAEHAVPRQRSPLRSRSARAVVAQADRPGRQGAVEAAAREIMDLYDRLCGRKRGPRNALDIDVIGEPSPRLTKAQEDNLMDLTYNILCGFSRGAAEHPRFGILMPAQAVRRYPGQVLETLTELLQVRADFGPVRVAVELTPEETTCCWNAWKEWWCQRELRAHQVRKGAAKRSSIFNAFVWKQYGSTQFAKAMLQVGTSITGSGESGVAAEHAASAGSARGVLCEALQPGGAAEHATNAARERQGRLDETMAWMRRFCNAWREFGENPATQTARMRSAGLTQEQQLARAQRDAARRRLGAARRLVQEGREEEQLAPWKRELLRKYRSGLLQQELLEAERNHGGAVAARPFRV
eukprot:NODE_484_length_1531_cov_4.577236.p1 GENE.NODE_484_length_1531_cov_4.577236~~NODE_484_length_1531_cov_4.577236.p1  ORF type:complete len:414 (+),score=26.34 NODE_484_length_1531_cov_4.577236:171-1412(+)